MKKRTLFVLAAVAFAMAHLSALAFAQAPTPGAGSPRVSVSLKAWPCPAGQSCLEVKALPGTTLRYDDPASTVVQPIVVQVPTAATPAHAHAACASCGHGGASTKAGESSGWCGTGWCTWLKWLAVAVAVAGLFLWVRSQRMALAGRRGEAAAARELYFRYNGVNPNAPETLRALERWHQADGEMRGLVWWRRLRIATTNTLHAPLYTPDPLPPPPAPPAPPAAAP